MSGARAPDATVLARRGSAGTTPRGARHGALALGGAAGAPAMRGWGARLHAPRAMSDIESSSGPKRSGRDVSVAAEPRRAIDRGTSIVFTNRESSTEGSVRNFSEYAADACSAGSDRPG